jgi:hypothetical protein
MDLRFDPPVHENTPLFSAWVARQFERIQQGLFHIPDERFGVSAVTGNLSVPTGLQKVQYAVACFYGDPSAPSLALACRPDVVQGNILIRVFSSTGALSTSAINVAWVAYGF